MMIRQLVAAIITMVLFINCGLRPSAKSSENEQKIIKKDTIIPLTKTVSLYYASYNKDMKLWYDLSLIQNKKYTKISTESSYDGIGSELFTSLSPNSDFVVVDSIIKGFVYESDKDSTLHENYTCSIIDLKKGKIVATMQQDCDGRWNKNNQWVSSSGKVIFR